MTDPLRYRTVFSEGVAEFLLALPKRRQRKVAALARQLAADPFVLSDYALRDDLGRVLEHLLIEDYVFAYWVDHGAKEVRIVEIEDAS